VAAITKEATGMAAVGGPDMPGAGRVVIILIGAGAAVTGAAGAAVTGAAGAAVTGGAGVVVTGGAGAVVMGGAGVAVTGASRIRLTNHSKRLSTPGSGTPFLLKRHSPFAK
jgi:trimeric autotransporter adhesin